MSSPELLRAQAERWISEQRQDNARSSADTATIDAELTKLRAEESRYAKAYGAGLFDLDQLKAYAAPVRARISALEKQLLDTGSARHPAMGGPGPSTKGLHEFALKAAGMLHGLNFEGKRAIVTHVLDKVVGTQKELLVTGHLPISEHVKNQPDDRDGVSTTRHPKNDNFPMLPFEFTIELPAPNYQTIKGCPKTRTAA